MPHDLCCTCSNIWCLSLPKYLLLAFFYLSQDWSWCRWCWKWELLHSYWCPLAYLYNVWGTATIFTFSLSYKGGGIVMACSSLTKSNFTSEQSLCFPLCVACSVLKLGWMNTFSAPSLYCPLFTQRWWLSCAKAFTEGLLGLQHFVNW